MNVNTPNSEPRTATTSHTRPAGDNTAADRPLGGGSTKEESLSELEYLEREAERTRAALSAAFQDVKESFREGMDVRVWTQQHPWIAVGVAAATGFAAAAAVNQHQSGGKTMPSAGESANGAAGHLSAAVQSTAASPTPQKSSFFTSALFDLAKLAIEASILAGRQAMAESEQRQKCEPPPEAASSPATSPSSARF